MHFINKRLEKYPQNNSGNVFQTLALNKNNIEIELNNCIVSKDKYVQVFSQIINVIVQLTSKIF